MSGWLGMCCGALVMPEACGSPPPGRLVGALNPAVAVEGRIQLGRGTRECLVYDWAGVSVSVTVTGSAYVAATLRGGGSLFTVLVDGVPRRSVEAGYDEQTLVLVENLDRATCTTVTLCKRTEPEVKGVLSSFGPVTFFGFVVESNAQLHTTERKQRSIEYVGDSDTVAFGVLGPVSGPMSFWTMDPNACDVRQGFAALMAEQFGASASYIAWTSKAVCLNPYMCGRDTIPDLYPRLVAIQPDSAQPPDCDHFPAADLVVLHCGGNDFFVAPRPTPEAFILAYQNLLRLVRSPRPDSVIVCVPLPPAAVSSLEVGDSARDTYATLLQECVREAVTSISDDKTHHVHLDGLVMESRDWATMMHWGPSGHAKVAAALKKHVRELMMWAPAVGKTWAKHITTSVDSFIDVVEPEHHGDFFVGSCEREPCRTQ
eukprot:comp24133_c0_seq1/m.43844 comp24133_c0_seq1/g.43844  ORF comp24133_c0_seq1/g.43844 comp24133_c0_seq1/m.43844 type:complete len:429 (-) comp24133_c0_seq1:181-1467(-)